jgi:hypothetical protein
MRTWFVSVVQYRQRQVKGPGLSLSLGPATICRAKLDSGSVTYE